MARKQIIIDGVTYDLGAEAQNVEYTNEDMAGVTNAEGALDNLNDRIGDIENPPEPIVAEYTEADATIIGTRIEKRAEPIEDANYKCTGFLTVPVGSRMYIKTDYAITSTLCLLLLKNAGTNHYAVSKGVLDGGPYTEWTEITMPDNTKCFRFTLPNNSSNHISIKFVAKPSIEGVVKLKVASWNVEGWAEARSVMTIDQMRKAYREVFDRVNADIICFSEYGRWLDGTSGQTFLAENEILCNYPFQKIGDNYDSYNYNVVVSKLPIVDVREYWYAAPENPAQGNGQSRYWKEVTIRLNGKDVKVIATHCDFMRADGNHPDHDNTRHFKQLIAKYANDPYVIIGADFNIHTWDWVGDYVSGNGDDGYNNYKYFTTAGYTLLNFDYLTLVNPKDGGTEVGTHTADNIAVKGFAMGKREYVPGTYGEAANNAPLPLSDHPMVACELVML